MKKKMYKMMIFAKRFVLILDLCFLLVPKFSFFHVYCLTAVPVFVFGAVYGLEGGILIILIKEFLVLTYGYGRFLPSEHAVIWMAGILLDLAFLHLVLLIKRKERTGCAQGAVFTLSVLWSMVLLSRSDIVQQCGELQAAGKIACGAGDERLVPVLILCFYFFQLVFAS